MSKLSFFILLLELKWVRFTSHFMVLYFRNLHLDLPKIFVLFWTPVLSRHGEENLTSRKNHLVHLWPTSFIRANYVQPPQKNFPVRRWQLLLKNRSMINTPEYKGKYTKKRTCFLYSYVKKTPSYSRILLNRFRIRLDPWSVFRPHDCFQLCSILIWPLHSFAKLGVIQI